MGQQIRKSVQATLQEGLHILPLGAQILTLEGTLPVEYVMPGDRIITRDSGMAVLRDKRVRHDKVNCVNMKPDAVATRAPRHELVLPVQTMLFLRNSSRGRLRQTGLFPVGRLLDGINIRYLGRPVLPLGGIGL